MPMVWQQAERQQINRILFQSLVQRSQKRSKVVGLVKQITPRVATIQYMEMQPASSARFILGIGSLLKVEGSTTPLFLVKVEDSTTSSYRTHPSKRPPSPFLGPLFLVAGHYSSLEPWQIALLYDNTFWGSANNGLCLGCNGLTFQNQNENPSVLRFGDIKSVNVESGFFGKKLRINGQYDVGITSAADPGVVAKALQRMILELAETARLVTEIDNSQTLPIPNQTRTASSTGQSGVHNAQKRCQVPKTRFE